LIVFPASLTKSGENTDKEPTPFSNPETTGGTKLCPACGQSNEHAAVFCIDCGSNLPAKDI